MEVLKFKYEISDAKGKFVESSQEETITTGKKEFIPRLEKILESMTVGEQKQVPLSAKDSFGEYQADLVFEVEKAKLGKDFKEGDSLGLKVNGGQRLKARVVDFKNQVAVLDCNHPLAGMDLVFNLTLIEKQEAPSEEAP